MTEISNFHASFLTNIRQTIENSLRKIADKHPEILESPKDVCHIIVEIDVKDGVGLVERHGIEFQGELIAEFWVKTDFETLKASISEIGFFGKIK